MKTWTINVVRVPLNEDCWLGINGLKPEVSGPAYQNALMGYVTRLLSHNLYVILELHWTAAGTAIANGQQPMPNDDHSIALWISVASRFKNKPNVIFDLFNEPYPDRYSWSDAWRCYRDGGVCEGITYKVAGM